MIAFTFGPFEFLKDIFKDLLYFLHDDVGITSWALSIIAMTAVVRMAILPITAKGTRSMLAMQRLQPHVKQLQQKYKHDRQELNVRMLEFYRDNKVNPLASCFPLLLQLPVFLALFFVLKDFAEEHPGPDLSFLMIDDITQTLREVGWSGYAMLVFYVISQMFASKVMMTSPDPMQRRIFMLLPIFIAPFLTGFAVGLLLYWITTNLWTLLQHVVIVALTDTNREVVLPRDSKGSKKIDPPDGGSRQPRSGGPKGGGGKAGGKTGGKAGGANAGKADNRPPPRAARKNKRRR